MVQYLYSHSNRAIFVCEFQSVREEIDEDLQVSPFVPINLLDEAQTDTFIYDSFEVDAPILGAEV